MEMRTQHVVSKFGGVLRRIADTGLLIGYFFRGLPGLLQGFYLWDDAADRPSLAIRRIDGADLPAAPVWLCGCVAHRTVTSS